MTRSSCFAGRLLLAGLVSCSPAGAAHGSGHGPVFGMATPTNATGTWSFDLGVMGRLGESDDGAMARLMLGYGLTEDLKISVSAPLVFSSAPLPPSRMAGMMPGSGDFETLLAWRFHRQALDVGSRFESTAYGGLVLPGPQRPAGPAGDLTRTTGLFTGVVTGLASRSHYVWVGAGYTRFAEARGDRRADLLMYSGVWGYRPAAWRKEYPHADWRFMVELTGERSGRMLHRGVLMPAIGGYQVFLGPSVLGLFRNYGISGGVQVPATPNRPVAQPRERLRYAANFSYFF